MNLYDILGIDKDSDQDAIKKAFRKRSMETHPDHHGDSSRTAFEEVQMANAILSNPEKREKYDRTGDVELESPDNPFFKPIGIIHGILIQILQQMDQAGVDPVRHDMVEILQQNIQKQIDDHGTKILKMIRLAENLRRIDSRTSVSKEDEDQSIFKMSLVGQAKMVEQATQQLNDHMEVLEKAMEMVQEHEFEVEHLDAHASKHKCNCGQAGHGNAHEPGCPLSDYKPVS
jgi:curved DNA-binding protein CbpA